MALSAQLNNKNSDNEMMIMITDEAGRTIVESNKFQRF
jgi:hypothetical protein